MNVLHIVPYGIFAINYVNSLTKFDLENKHFFWLWGYSSFIEKSKAIKFDSIENVITAGDYSSLKKIYDKSDVVVMQCMIENISVASAVYECFEQECKPLIMVPWGRDINRTSDIYNFDREIWEPVDNLKKYFSSKTRYVISSRNFYSELSNYYGMNCPCCIFDSLMAYKYKDYELIDHSKNLSLLIAHRGTPTSRHIEILNKVSHYKDKIGKIICPLSYGNRPYIDDVCKIGSLLFGEKWNPILEWMNLDSYHDYLNKNVDIGIFFGPLEGATTIHTLIGMGKTLLINENCSVTELLDQKKIYYKKVKSVEDIELSKISIEQSKFNREAAKRVFGLEEFIKNWQKIISYVAEGKE